MKRDISLLPSSLLDSRVLRLVDHLTDESNIITNPFDEDHGENQVQIGEETKENGEETAAPLTDTEHEADPLADQFGASDVSAPGSAPPVSPGPGAIASSPHQQERTTSPGPANLPPRCPTAPATVSPSAPGSSATGGDTEAVEATRPKTRLQSGIHKVKKLHQWYYLVWTSHHFGRTP